MTLLEYQGPLNAAGLVAIEANSLVGALRQDLRLRRKYGQGSLKLYGFGGSSVVFQPAPTGKEMAAGLLVQIRPDFPRQRASDVRTRVRENGGTSHDVFNLIPTNILVSRWDQIRQTVLEPFLVEGR